MALNNDKLMTWQARLDEAESLQSGLHQEWKESLSLYEGTWFKQFQFNNDPDATAVNYASAYIKTMVDTTYARNPFIFVKPRHSRYSNFAYSMQRALNYYWRELNLKKQMKRGVLHTGINGISWVETGFTMDIGQLNLQEDKGVGGLLDKMMGKSKTESEQGVPHEFIKSASPFAIARSPYKVLMAPGYSTVHEMPYVFIAEDISPEDIEKHPLYSKHIDTRAVKATRVINSAANMISSPFRNRKLSGVESGGLVLYRLWHVWDKRNMERTVLVEGSDISIGPFPWSYCHDGFPVVPIMFNEVPENDEDANPYPQGDLVPMLPLLRELNQLRTAMVRHRKRSGTLIIVPDTMSEEEVDNIRSGDDVSVVQVSAGFIDMIRPHNPPQLAPDVYRINERILADLDLVGGFSQTILGGTAAKDTLATEINTQNQGSAIRTSAKVDEVENATRDIARRLAANIWEFMDREKVRMILGESELTESMWPSVPESVEERRAFIQNEIEIEIEAGATQPPKDRTIEREQWLKALDVINLLAPERIKKGALIKRTLEKFDERNLEDVLMSEAEIHMPSIQQENQLLAQGIPQVVTPDEPHELHLAEHGKIAQQGVQSPALDQHIQQHAQYYQSKNGGAQGGGPNQNARRPNAEVGRSGAPTESDILGPVSRGLKESGAERGGIPNV